MFELTLPVTISEPVFAATAEPVLTVKLNVLPSPLVNVSVFELTLPVTISEPVFAATPEPVLTVKLKVDPSPLVNVSTLLETEPVAISELRLLDRYVKLPSSSE